MPAGFSKEEADLSERMALALAADCQLYWPSPHAVCGAIRDKYNAMGGPGSWLSFPNSPEYQNPGNTGARSEFLNGSIYWSANTGAHPITLLFMTKWSQHNWEAGWMGYPTTDEIPNGDNVGSRQEFQHGGAAIYWHASPLPGLAVIGGAIRDKWNQLGGLQGPLGYPTSDEVDVPQILAYAGTRMNTFEAGAIVWDAIRGAEDGQWWVGEGSSAVPITADAAPANDPGEVSLKPGPAKQVLCPPATKHDADSEYNCKAAWLDAYGVTVVAREGRPDAYAWSGHGAFGFAHAWDDHNMGLNAIGKIVNVSKKTSIGGRKEYMAQFKIRNTVPIRAFVRTQETPMTESGAEDSYAMGLVTAYCKTGTQAGENKCEPWVNGSLGP